MNQLVSNMRDNSVTRRGLLKRALIAAGGVTAVVGGFIPADFLAAAASSTSGVWRRLTLATWPSKRAYAAMAYDAANANVVLFSGLAAPADTWVYGEGGWTARSAPGPSSRAGASMAYDPFSDAVVLFGGLTQSRLANDTWSWSGGGWTQLSPTHTPNPRIGAALAYDPISQRLLLYGGVSDVPDNDTWTWTGSDWVLASHNSGPGEIRGASLEVDTRTGRLRLIGGWRSPMGIPADNRTWTWDGRQWLPDAPATTAPAFGAHAEFPSHRAMALVGGFEGGTFSDRGWVQEDGSTRQFGATRPGARAYASMAFEPHTNGLLLFGGQDAHGLLDEVWLWTEGLQ